MNVAYFTESNQFLKMTPHSKRNNKWNESDLAVHNSTHQALIFNFFNFYPIKKERKKHWGFNHFFLI